MLKNNLTIFFRMLMKNKLSASIKIGGMVIGIAATLLIALFINDELGYDTFHQNASRIYRVAMDGGPEFHNPLTPMPFAPGVKGQFPEVGEAVRISKTRGADLLFSRDNERFYEKDFIYADSSFFKMFSFNLLKGNPAKCLAEPHTMVISENAAQKFFGLEDPMGNVIHVEGDTTGYLITGIVENVSKQSHFHFDYVLSFASMNQQHADNWLIPFMFTYLLLPEDYPYKSLEPKLTKYAVQQMNPQMKHYTGKTFEEFLAKEKGQYQLYLQPLADIHLHSNLRVELEANGDIRYVRLFSLIAVLILLMACINFTNLSTAQSISRAKEVGVRKVAGAFKGQLVQQFMTEAMLYSALATLLAVLLVEFSLPSVNVLLGKQLVWLSLNNWQILLSLLAVTLLTGIAAGAYPAFYLASFKPQGIFQKMKEGWGRTLSLRKGLVVAQFAVASALIFGTIVIRQQLDFMKNKDLGFQKEQVLVLPLRQSFSADRQRTIQAQWLQQPGITDVSFVNYLPGQEAYENQDMFVPEGKTAEDAVALWYIRGDPELVKTLGFKVLQGRAFNRRISGDSAAYILNETAVRQLGWTPETAVGKTIGRFGNGPGDLRQFTVVGVVKDFYFEAFTTPVKPMVLGIKAGYGSQIVVRFQQDALTPTLAFLEKEWTQHQAGYPFQYSFLDKDFVRLWASDQRLSQVLSLFTGLAIFIGCLGLFGLAAYASEQRRKEIGIRRVLGATAVGIIALLSKDFLKLVIIALVIASPLAWYFMNGWLENFAYRITIGWWVFAMAGLATVGVAFLTVSFQSVKAALANPVKSLRSE